MTPLFAYISSTSITSDDLRAVFDSVPVLRIWPVPCGSVSFGHALAPAFVKANEREEKP
jgi:hypothetical protein